LLQQPGKLSVEEGGRGRSIREPLRSTREGVRHIFTFRKSVFNEVGKKSPTVLQKNGTGESKKYGERFPVDDRGRETFKKGRKGPQS